MGSGSSMGLGCAFKSESAFDANPLDPYRAEFAVLRAEMGLQVLHRSQIFVTTHGAEKALHLSLEEMERRTEILRKRRGHIHITIAAPTRRGRHRCRAHPEINVSRAR
jgi:hypothetical protein